MFGFKDLYHQIFVESNNKNFLIYYQNGNRVVLSNTDYIHYIDSISCRVTELLKSISLGSWVGIKCKNNPFWFAIVFGILKSGYRVLLLDENVPDVLLANYVAQADLKAIVVDTPIDVKDVATIDYLELISSNPEQDTAEDNWADSIAFCTSGTTGNAKIFVFNAYALSRQTSSIAGFISSDEAIIDMFNLGEDAKYNVLSFLPFRHCTGFGATLAIWQLQYTVVLPKQMNIMGIIQTIKEEEVFLTVSVPAYLKAFLRLCRGTFKTLDRASFSRLFGDTLKIVINAGAKIDSITIDEYLKLGISFLNGYGMTEIGILSIGNSAKYGSSEYVGYPIDSNSIVKVLNEEDDTLLEDGFGQLMVRSDSMFYGVLKDGVVEKLPLYKDTYYSTGDLFKVSNREIFYVGRDKNVIINDGGENVYPEELMEHFEVLSDYVEQFCIFGIDEKPTLILYLKDGADIDSTIKQVIIERNSVLPIHKKISKVLVSNSKLPLTTKGEVSIKNIKDTLSKNTTNIKEVTLKG